MNPERWQAVGELFEEALAQPDGERTRWVEVQGAADHELLLEVKSLLASHRQAGGFFQDKVRDAVVAFDASASERSPRRAGPYRLVQELGRGGMGTVYLAERDDEEYRAQVAVKLVRPGMDTEFILARFRRERQTLARLHHPNIARLLDGGTTGDGLPYIVMEYVDGPRLTEYARKNNLGVHARLRLFLDVCSAVDYAHRNFVVHRDLKPGNILVDSSGVPKLLDFGICKLLESDVFACDETQDAPLTPDYASPEQLRGEAITPLSDLYSLGVVLHELLWGATPRRFDGKRRPAGDLENIALRALAPEPERRYESVAEFAADIRRYLASEPVHARAATLRYRTMKLIRRRPWQVAAGIALIVVLFAALYQWHVARRRLAMVSALADTLIVDVHDAVRDLPGATSARQKIVAIGLQYLDAEAREGASAAADLALAYRKLGDAQGYVAAANLGNTAGALASYQKAEALLDRAPLTDAVRAESVVVRERIGTVLAATGHVPDAIRAFDEGSRLGEAYLTRSSAPDLKAALATLYLQAGDAHRAADANAALQDAERAIALSTSRHDLATAYASAGMAKQRLNRLSEALEDYRRGLAEMQQLVDAEPANVNLKRDLMLAYGHLGDGSGDVGPYRKAAEIGHAIYEGERGNFRAVMDYAISLSRVAGVLPERDPERIVVARRSLALLDEAARINSKSVAIAVYREVVNRYAGDAQRAQGDRDGAFRSYTEALKAGRDGIQAHDPSSSIGFLLTSRRIAENEVARGNRAAALEYAKAAADAVAGPGVPPFVLPRGYAAMGFTQVALGNRDEARSWLAKALTAWRAAQSERGFVEVHRKEMEEVEAALRKL